MRGVVSRAVSRMGRLGAVLLVVGMAGCGGGREPTEPVATDSEPSAIEPTSEPTPEPSPESPELDLEAGWVVVDEYPWTVQPGCCGMADVGPTSPPEWRDWEDWSAAQEDWPPDGFYAVDVLRTADAPSRLQLTVRAWVTCSDLPDEPCAPDPAPDPVTGEDLRLAPAPDPALLYRTVRIDDLRVVLVPIHRFGAVTTVALDGEPGAFGTLLMHGIDTAFRQWIGEPLQAGVPPETIRADLLERSRGPDFPFGLDYCEGEACGPLAFRGPFGTSLLADPGWVSDLNGVYGWRPITLEVRDGQPVLHLWAGQIAG